MISAHCSKHYRGRDSLERQRKCGGILCSCLLTFCLEDFHLSAMAEEQLCVEVRVNFTSPMVNKTLVVQRLVWQQASLMLKGKKKRKKEMILSFFQTGIYWNV